MKKIFIFAFFAFASCTGDNRIEKALENYVVEHSEVSSDDLDYKLVSYNVIDTLTNKDVLDSLESILLREAFLWTEPSKDSLLKIKSTQFPDYFMQYEESFAEVKKHRDVIDSLIAKWEDVTPYSYELNYESVWPTLAKCTIYDIEPGEYFSEHFNGMVENESVYRTADSLSRFTPDDIFGYQIEHKYSIINPLLDKKVNITNIVILDKDLNFVSSENANSGMDMINQILK